MRVEEEMLRSLKRAKEVILRLTEENRGLLEACKEAYERLTDNDVYEKVGHQLVKKLEIAIDKAGGFKK